MAVILPPQPSSYADPGLDGVGEVGGGEEVVEHHGDRVLLHAVVTGIKNCLDYLLKVV